MGKGKGQPRTSHFVRFTIAYKVVQYIKRYNLTPRQAWLKLSEVDDKGNWKKRGFQQLLEEHYKNREFDTHFIGQLKDRTARINFYKNHIKKFVDEYLSGKEKEVEDKETEEEDVEGKEEREKILCGPAVLPTRSLNVGLCSAAQRLRDYADAELAEYRADFSISQSVLRCVTASSVRTEAA